ncbi:MAG: hypothetical protein V3T96_00335 [Thermodesulfobacteriota bacterium]
MRNKYFIFLTIFFVAFTVGCKSLVKESDTRAVQGAMDRFIQDKLAKQGGTYEIRGIKAEFDYLHAGVEEEDGLFVSCADFKVGDDVYDIDYYVKAEDDKYTVVKEVLHKKNGKLINEVLWQPGQ